MRRALYREVQHMELDVFYLPAERKICVIPAKPTPVAPSVPADASWRYLMRTTLEDRLLSGAKPIIEAEVSVDGYAVLNLVH